MRFKENRCFADACLKLDDSTHDLFLSILLLLSHLVVSDSL